MKLYILNRIFIIKVRVPLKEFITFMTKISDDFIVISRVYVEKKSPRVAPLSINVDINRTFLFEKKTLVKTFGTVHPRQCNMSLQSF
jgi:hypothetical protein